MAEESIDDTPEGSTDDAPEGLITLRGAAVGVGLLWLTAVAAIGALFATIYGVRTAPLYLVVALLAGGVAVAAGYGSLRAFGVR